MQVAIMSRHTDTTSCFPWRCEHSVLGYSEECRQNPELFGERWQGGFEFEHTS